MTQHTPTPWYTDIANCSGGFIWSRAGDQKSKRIADVRCDVGGLLTDEEQQANAAFIVEACNNHDRLKDVLFQRDSRIETLEHNAKIHLQSAIKMQQDYEALKASHTKLVDDIASANRALSVAQQYCDKETGAVLGNAISILNKALANARKVSESHDPA